MKPPRAGYPYIYIIRYIPQKYSDVSVAEQYNRDLVYAFKAGHCPVKYMERITSIIKNVSSRHPEKWIVLFVPASGYKSHIERYITLRDYIEDNTSVHVYLEALMYIDRKNPVHKSSIREIIYPLVNDVLIKGKNVFLIDDVITTGESFRQAGNILKRAGARRIFGIIFAKTSYPSKN